MSALPAPFTAAHRSYVKSLYRRILKNELDWIVQRNLWRGRALAVRAEFESNRCVCSAMFARPDLMKTCAASNVHDPRALATILEKAEADLEAKRHLDPYRRKWLVCRIVRLHDPTVFQHRLPPMARNGAY